MVCANARRFIREGFTLMELMIVIIILGILAAVVGPQLFRARTMAQKRAAKSTLRAFKNGILLFESHTGQLPQRLRDLVKKPREERLAKKWEGPYLSVKEIPRDPWGEKYIYRVTTGAINQYELHTYGPNRKGAPKEEWLSIWDE